MRIGIPEGLLYHRYKPFVNCFINELGMDAVFSGPSNHEILEEGIRTCVDEACLPIKIFHGHVSKLRKECDKIVVPRLMKCEFGDSICPKFAGLPELVRSGSGKDDLIFTQPLFLNNKKKLQQTLVKEANALGINTGKAKKAFMIAYEHSKQKDKPEGSYLIEVKQKSEVIKKCPVVALLGHPYNTMDPFINMNITDKLQRLGVQVVIGNKIFPAQKSNIFDELMKKPYWRFFRDNYGTAGKLIKGNSVDGIIYVSSFNCGTDSFTIEMIRNKIGDFPMLVLKLDEHTGEAGFNTRIEAFTELLERRKEYEDYLSEVGE